MRWLRHVVGIVLLLACGTAVRTVAHEIPRTVTVQAFVKTDGQRLRVIVRVPLDALRDVQFPQRDGFLDIASAEPVLRDAVRLWILPDLSLFADGRELPPPAISTVRVSLPSDRAFGSYEEALAHVTAPSEVGSGRIAPEQALLDTLLEYPVASEGARLAIRPAFQRLGVDVVTALRFAGPDGVRAFELRGDPGVVRLDPRWHQAALHFVGLGFSHILDGVDHLLFLVCLVIPLRRLRPLVLVVTAFTAAHSVTLIASALDLAPSALWFPPLVEMLIAASIVYMAIENVLATRVSTARRTALAFGFGLVHGFGFSFALKETLQFAGSHLVASLLSFNVGVELGQLAVLVLLVPAMHLLFRYTTSERLVTIVLSVLVAHTAWHWMTERWDALRQFEGPALDAAMLIAIVRLALIFVAGAAVWWAVKGRAKAVRAQPSEERVG